MNPSQVIENVAIHYNVNPRYLRSDVRQAHIVRPRRVAMWLLRTAFGLSYSSIGRLFHKDHSTVIESIQAIEAIAPVDTDVQRLGLRYGAIEPQSHESEDWYLFGG